MVFSKLSFQVCYDWKMRPLLGVSDGLIDDGKAADMGLLWYEPKRSDQYEVGFWYYRFPLNTAAIDNVKKVFRRKGYKVKINMLDQNGNDLSSYLLPKHVTALQKDWVQSISTGKAWQADEGVYGTVSELIARYHPNLACNAILVLMEDFDPKDKAKSLGSDDTVFAYTMLAGSSLRWVIGYDFKICLCDSIWGMLNEDEKVCLLDHELMHCGRDEKGRLYLRKHDYEVFKDEVRRYPELRMIKAKLDGLIKANDAGKKMKSSATDEPVKMVTKQSVRRKTKKVVESSEAA